MSSNPKNTAESGGSSAPTKGSGPSLALVLTLAFIVLSIGVGYRIMLDIREGREISKGRNGSIADYGFDLSNLTVKRELISRSNRGRDGFKAMYEPGHITVTELAEINDMRRGKYVLPDDCVIGVNVGTESCAYPMQVLNWHEVVNDTLGGQPIAVTYNGLADLSIVYDRRLEGKPLVLAVSGMVFNSNTVLYDRQGDPAEAPQELSGQESLWSQCTGTAIAGPLAGQSLKALPAQVMLWKDWLAAHPDTLVLRRDDEMVEEYKKDVYGPYFQTEKLEFIVSPLGTTQERINFGLTSKSRVFLLSGGGRNWLLGHAGVLKAATFDAAGLGTLKMDTAAGPLTLLCRDIGKGSAPATVWLAPESLETFEPLATGFFFAFKSQRPDYEVLPTDALKPAAPPAETATTSP